MSVQRVDPSGHDTESSGAPNDVGPQGIRFAAGSVIDGRFEVEGTLGDGGMGYVLAARHRQLDERVAIKLLLPDKAGGDARERLLREAQNASKIKSEHSVRIYDIVTTGSAAPYIVMELLTGESVARRFAGRKPLPIDEVVDIVLQACEAIGEAHQLRIVHRDLKPSNLFLVDRPGRGELVKVLDFGVSKRFEVHPSHELTQSRTLVGSPVYAPPEQLRASQHVDRRADIWSLGVILYQGLTGSLPFVGDTLAEVCTRILQDPPPMPRALRPEIPSALELAVLRCLEKRPERRFGSVEELVVTLREFSPTVATKTLIYLDAVRASLGPDVEQSQTRPIEPSDALGVSTATLAERSPVRPTRRTARGFLIGTCIAAAMVGVFVTGRVRGPSSGGPIVDSVRPSPQAASAPTMAVVASAQARNALSESPAPPSIDSSAPAPALEKTPVRTPAPGASRHVTAAKRPIRTAGHETHPWVDSR
jgi:eukaryotic-like serine/threonine-protein kinase